ncbi:caspase family protein [Azospirillum picis]|uniref:Caspase family p20 domain-containing protein n=1 Tax=Azospirillum picis TaxID=488438 RepID=A0ABU0MQZ9_9PROT|nr:caspase family protein [Azospirillum picis]MBP2302321.1 hypothetical protein [Azospirillum picis]MDQ0535900.1 hypothetical protein [Azospirillum picis]
MTGHVQQRKAPWWRGLLAGTALAATLVAGPALAESGRRVALVIDNGRYPALESRPANASANAAAMASALRRAGFSVTRADNVTRIAMESALERFRETLSGADLGFVYYSGLAVGLDEREYLLPTDAAAGGAEDLSRSALDLDALLADLKESGRKTVVVIDPAPAEALAQRVGGGALGTPVTADGLFVVYAHRPGVPPVPPSSAKGADPFTAALAREMVRPGVSFRDALAEVARAVAERSGGRQLPWLQDRIGGDLVLVPPASQTPPQNTAQNVARNDTTAAAKGERPVPDKPAPPREEPATATAARELPEVTSPSLSPGDYRMAKDGVLFDRPAVGAHGVARLSTGATVTVLDSVPQGSWLRVRDPDGQVGYLTAGSLAARWGDPTPLAAQPRGTVEAGPAPGVSPDLAPYGDTAAAPAAGGSSDSFAGGPVAAQPPGGAGSIANPPAPRSSAQSVTQSPAPTTEAATEPATWDSPAVTAERRAMRALGDARTAAERAGSRPDSRYWTYGFSGGDRYEGSWAQPKAGSALGRPIRDGSGVYRFSNGQTYEGEWADDLMSGYGVMTFNDGSRFAGRFRDGQPDGPGVFHYTNGSQSAGLWRGAVRVDR